jgi:hypothetical protein
MTENFAREEDRLGDARHLGAVDAIGKHQARGLGLDLLVARERISPERPGERADRAAMALRHLGQAVDSGRQGFGEMGERERVLALAQAEHGRADRALRIGDQLQVAVLGGETHAVQERRLALRPCREPALEIAFAHRMKRHRALCILRKANLHERPCLYKARELRNARAQPQPEEPPWATR